MKRRKENLSQRMWSVAARVWLGIREWCGDAAYDRYLKSQTRTTCTAALLTREQFYVEQLQKRYSRASRCC
jgi:uncharacterized short protein YbdD (DUF466 family)